MTRLTWYGYEAQADMSAVRDYYARAGDWACTCGHCRNFLALARERQLPEELLAILDSLSIPPEKATCVCELCHGADWREKGLLYEVSWRIAGAVVREPESGGSGETPWGAAVGRPGFRLMLGHEACPVRPEFPKPNFDLGVSLYLPWVLDEHVDGPEKRRDEL